MTRRYELKRRAERQEQTRRRIVEATVDLHSQVGPVRTTISAIAERAGVQRHTVYSHFPDELALYLACSALGVERNPLPDADALRAVADPHERLRAGLDALYAWFERDEPLLTNLARDLEIDATTRQVFEQRIAGPLRTLQDVLAAGLVRGRGHARARTAAALALALDFHAWRTLTRQGRLPRAQAVEVMARAVRCAGSP